MALVLHEWFIFILTVVYTFCVTETKVFKRCELAKVLHQEHNIGLKETAMWVCIAEYSSSFNTAAHASTASGGSHGLFQISDVYWCSPTGQGKGCNVDCSKLRDDDLSDDLSCIKHIYDEHQRFSGDGYTAWNAYKQSCKDKASSDIQDCFLEEQKAPKNKTAASLNSYKNYPFLTNLIQQIPAKTCHIPSLYNDINISPQGQIYTRCSLAQDLYFKYNLPIEQISTLVCVAEYESQFNTAAVIRSYTDGSTDYGLFQISDRHWCDPSPYGGNACNLPCYKLLDADISDDVACIKTIYNELTRLLGYGFNSWTIYKPHCQNRNTEHIQSCFEDKFLKSLGTIQPLFNRNTAMEMKSKPKIYKKCELAQELYDKHNIPMDQVAIWVCIAQYMSSLNTAAVRRLSTSGSADYGLFQLSDLYWCDHSPYGGKACNMRCDKLLDSDLTDDVKCIKTIYEQHAQFSGDGFNAWPVYKSHCRPQIREYISECLSPNEIEDIGENQQFLNNHYYHNPFSSGLQPPNAREFQ